MTLDEQWKRFAFVFCRALTDDERALLRKAFFAGASALQTEMQAAVIAGDVARVGAMIVELAESEGELLHDRPFASPSRAVRA